jgi:hypothetical protein
MSLEMAHKVILPPKKNYIPQFLKQRDINSYSHPLLSLFKFTKRLWFWRQSRQNQKMFPSKIFMPIAKILLLVFACKSKTLNPAGKNV